MTCVSVDIEGSKVVMVPDMETLPEPSPKKDPPERAAAPATAKSKKKRDWGHDGATPVEEPSCAEPLVARCWCPG